MPAAASALPSGAHHLGNRDSPRGMVGRSPRGGRRFGRVCRRVQACRPVGGLTLKLLICSAIARASAPATAGRRGDLPYTPRYKYKLQHSHSSGALVVAGSLSPQKLARPGSNNPNTNLRIVQRCMCPRRVRERGARAGADIDLFWGGLSEGLCPHNLPKVGRHGRTMAGSCNGKAGLTTASVVARTGQASRP